MELKIIFKRVITNEVLTTYLPTGLLMAIVYATTFFKAESYETNITVTITANLSVMFVMTTLFVSVVGKLPQTSYLRMVDIWLIYGQLLPFIQVMLITYMESCRQEKFKEKDIMHQTLVAAAEIEKIKQDSTVQVKDIHSSIVPLLLEHGTRGAVSSTLGCCRSRINDTHDD